jgi:hypothetical protein
MTLPILQVLIKLTNLIHTAGLAAIEIAQWLTKPSLLVELVVILTGVALTIRVKLMGV